MKLCSSREDPGVLGVMNEKEKENGKYGDSFWRSLGDSVLWDPTVLRLKEAIATFLHYALYM